MTDLTKGKKSNYAWIDCKNMIFFDIMHPFMSQSGAINHHSWNLVMKIVITFLVKMSHPKIFRHAG